MAIIRYPGSKAKLADSIVRRFPPEFYGPLFRNRSDFEYREPFFGAGAVGFAALERVSPAWSIWLNDKDIGIVTLWQAVAFNPWELCDRIRDIKPSAELFYQLKEEDGRQDLPTAEIAARKVALHRLSYSGLGFMSGGPLGGRDQGSKYNVACRWNPETICKDIAKLHRRLKRFESLEITHGDFAKVIDDAPEHSFIYLDPPYYEKGPQLYRYAMDEEDHRVLAVLLRKCRARWILSYDDHPEIRRLYGWAHIEPVRFKYTMARARGAERPKNQEIIISAEAS